MPLNLSQLLAETAARQPDSPAILGPGPEDCLTYAQAEDAVADLARRLANVGIGQGDCVGLHCPSGVGYILNTYAVWRCGGCVVPVPVELAPPEKQTILRTIALPWLISSPRTMGFAEEFARGAIAEIPGGLAVAPLRLQRQHPIGFGEINCAFLRFTSGTTGAAKGVVLSHETIRDRIDAANEVLGIGPADRVVWLLSMSYHFAVSIVAYVTFGAAIVLPATNLAAGILEAARRHRATLIYGSPVHYGWLASANAEPLPDLRLAVSTTTALDPETALRFMGRYGLPLTQALGIIEIGLPFINRDSAAENPQAIGRVLPAYKLKLEDAGIGGRQGEILLGGKGFLDAYYEPWRPRADVMPDGWFRTGDVGEVGDDGCIILRGRKKDVIDVLGMKFFPQEVEAALMSHPAVDAAAVLTRPDDRLGTVVQAQVTLRKGGLARPAEMELIEHCRGQLAAFKVPERITFVPALERTASGKVIRSPAAGGGP